jgi:F-type H+-transporting ATPase subunit alpha
VNVGLSVSRVGGAAQVKAMRQVAGQLRLQLAQFRELAAFAQFASDLDKATRAQLELGQRLTEVLKQPQYAPMPLDRQVMIIFAATNGYLDDVPVEKVKLWEEAFHPFVTARYPDISRTIMAEKALNPETIERLKAAIMDFKAQWA